MHAEGDTRLLLVRLTPRGGRDALDGRQALSDGRMVPAARVRAILQNGAANAALETLLARKLGDAGRAMKVVAGATSRLKTIRFQAAYQDMRERLARRGVVLQS
ncbi:MAG: DUF167 domain-containing protein [Methylobacterium sp.]|jgi:uncharacterized protein YggU (UPF0235/DUF167 family)|nr:DUF167 domain-containing protein [Methylobacterium sp.]MCA3605972.1 DUF167 domain-containing protein [Methylobacterium sp.]MCA3608232.1 DUF167 domain-containing protein [Methylobacterium sp.]MCA3612380.1 DUF167 domain-containing protein [Methylobacterium sp.]MCA3616956.1 DUF167 domain-containing protein [Methylobacterium sp.]